MKNRHWIVGTALCFALLSSSAFARPDSFKVISVDQGSVWLNFMGKTYEFEAVNSITKLPEIRLTVSFGEEVLCEGSPFSGCASAYLVPIGTTEQSVQIEKKVGSYLRFLLRGREFQGKESVQEIWVTYRVVRKQDLFGGDPNVRGSRLVLEFVDAGTPRE
jgi:hypothetical protein